MIPNSNCRPADILVQSSPPPLGEPPPLPIAYYVTVRSPYVEGTKKKAAIRPDGAAETTVVEKGLNLERALRKAFLPSAAGPLHTSPGASPP